MQDCFEKGQQMATQRLTQKKANSESPQIVTLVVDDSGSMSADSKCIQATEALKQMVMEIQGGNMGAGGYRYLVNIAKFGDEVTPIAECAAPGTINIDALNFTGESGGTEMAPALEWASAVTDRSLKQLRALPKFKEEAAPNPIVVFFSDGETPAPTWPRRRRSSGVSRWSAAISTSSPAASA
jgi:VWA domain-containing protein